MDHVIYTDGSVHPNPNGFGGWAYVRYETGVEGWTEKFGGVEDTTNNRMEMQAAIEALRDIPEESSVEVRSDSQYLVNTMEKGWNRGKNNDLWRELDILCEARNVAWVWVRGHDGNKDNELADRLANKGRLEILKESGDDGK